MGEYGKRIIPFILSMLFLGLSACGSDDDFNTYGVYLSSDYESLPKDLRCQTLVIDAQYYSREEIKELHENNKVIYSYLNVGAIEDFRDYYLEYRDLAIGEYEHWPEEQFIDVSDEDWQDFLIQTLAVQLTQKGIDGFFIDNLDVYDLFHTEEIYAGITTILEGLNQYGLDIIVNGGDVYVKKYLEENEELKDLIDGINQETVFSSINWDEETLGRSTSDDQEYYMEYLEIAKAKGAKVFVIEYTEDEKFAKEIRKKCLTLDYEVYVSDSIELD